MVLADHVVTSKRKKTSDHLRQKFSQNHNQLRMSERRARYINSLCNAVENNPKRFWSLFKLKSKCPWQNIGEKLTKTFSCITICRKCRRHIATLFNRYFASIFTIRILMKTLTTQVNYTNHFWMTLFWPAEKQFYQYTDEPRQQQQQQSPAWYRPNSSTFSSKKPHFK